MSDIELLKNKFLNEVRSGSKLWRNERIINFVEEMVNSVSISKAYVNYFDFSSEAETQINVTNTWYKLNTDTQLGFGENGLIHSNNRVTNEGENTKIVKLEAITSLSAGSNREIHLAFFKNDNLIPCAEQSVFTGSGTRVVALPIQCVTELAVGDYVEVWVKNATGSQNVTVDNINVIITEL